MEVESTIRGFSIAKFKDANGVECSLQKSSSIGDGELLWVGCNKANPRMIVKGEGWVPVEMPSCDWIADTRMHLSQEQVAELLPYLQRFVETGEIT